MTAYGAVNSLRNTIDYILHSSHFSLVDPSPRILQLAYEELDPLQEILESLDRTRTSKSRKKVNGLDGRITDLIWEFEDALESLLYQQILSQVEDEGVMEEAAWESRGLLKSPPSQQILSQVEDEGIKEGARGFQHLLESLLFESPPLHHTTTTTTTRRVLHKHEARIMRESQASQSRSLEDEGMKEGSWGFQHLLDSLLFESHPLHHLSESLPSQSRSLEVGGERMRFSIDLQFLQHHVPSFIQRLKDMKEEYIYEVDNMPEDDFDDQSISSRSGTKSKMIGLSDQFQQLKASLMKRSNWSTANEYIAIHGSAGIGKTTLAAAVFEDPDILRFYECRVWVSIGRKSQFDEVSRSILAEMSGVLQSKNCLIVLDDVWEKQIMDSLEIFLLQMDWRVFFCILVTTRDTNTTSPRFSRLMMVRFLKEEESKELLCEKVFGEKDCPFQLDKAATKIAKKCEGLPLMIVTVANILSKSQSIDPKYWDDVAENRNSVFIDAYNEISKVLLPSYDYLPQYLKMPFLYMGVFPPDYDIPFSKIRIMLATEGWFHNPKEVKFFEGFIGKCLYELCSCRSLALFNRPTIHKYSKYLNFKNLRLHSSWRYVCGREARKSKFYHVLKKLVEGLEDGVKGQRCLCLENNLLFSIKDFCNSVRLNCASSARSLFFIGPYHQYPVRVGDNFKLLGKLDALNLRLYTFPIEILTLVLLKYLALTCNGELPTTISKLFNLRVLIIHPHNNIRICRALSYVPIQIWDMQELEHIELLGKSLVPPCHSASLKKLSTLVGVNASICTISELFRKFPCMKKLGVQIAMTPHDDHNYLLSCFGCVSTLGSLKTLKCSIINPVFKHDYAFPSSLMKFPGWLKKLHLSGMGFSWDYM